MQIDPFLLPCTKVKSKWIEDLNIKPGTLKQLEEKVGKTLERISTGEISLNRTPMAYTLRSRINKWDFMKLQSFCKTKNTIEKTNQQSTEYKMIFTYLTSDRGLVSNIKKHPPFLHIAPPSFYPIPSI